MKYWAMVLLINFTLILTVLIVMAKLELQKETYKRLNLKLGRIKINQMLLENKINKL